MYSNTPNPVAAAVARGGMPLWLRIALIPALFVAALGLLLWFLTREVDALRGDTRVVDVAARQRVLTLRVVRDVLLQSEGRRDADWRVHRATFEETANALQSGGSAVYNITTGERISVPAAPNSDLRTLLGRQMEGMRDLSVRAEAYLSGEGEPAAGTARATRLTELLRAAESLGELANTTSKAYSAASVERVDDTVRKLLLIGGLVAVAGTLASWVIARQITEPLGRVVDRALNIGSGNLRGEPLPVRSGDEVGRLAATFNAMQEGLRSVAAQTREATENLNAAAAEILAAAQEQAAGAGEQSAAVQQTGTTMEEITRSGEQIADKARQVAAAAEQTSAASDAGLAAVGDTHVLMGEIQDQAQSVASGIVRLSERARSVQDIVASVNDVAEQTHLLALNAAIEAAGAGEAGRRFGVVADEMKHLADQSREATVQVRSILGEIQREIHQTVMLTEEAVKRVERGRRQSAVADGAIREMAESIVQSVNAFQQIVAATNQQQIGFEQVTQATQQIRVALDQATQGTRQLEAAALSLNDLAGQLRRSTEAYRT